MAMKKIRGHDFKGLLKTSIYCLCPPPCRVCDVCFFKPPPRLFYPPSPFASLSLTALTAPRRGAVFPTLIAWWGADRGGPPILRLHSTNPCAGNVTMSPLILLTRHDIVRGKQDDEFDGWYF